MDLIPRLDFHEGPYAGDPVLKCPLCGEHYLHQGRVDVFKRSEDEEAVTRTTVMWDGTASVATVANTGSGNPSSRRDGLTIGFSCEMCNDIFVLSISQHKGQTLVRWEPLLPGAPKRPARRITTNTADFEAMLNSIAED